MLIAMAQEKSEIMGLQDQVKFVVADAHDIPYENDSFDVLLTESVVLFMDKERALKEFARVVRPGGYVGLSEAFVTEDISTEAKENLEKAERLLSENVGLSVTIPTQSEWRSYFHMNGLQDVLVEEVDLSLKAGQWTEVVGRSGVAKVSLKALYHMMLSKRIRERLKRDDQLQKILIGEDTPRNSFGVILCIGRKGT